MTHAPMRAFLGFVAGALAVLTFHQGLVEVLHLLGLATQAAYRVTPAMPFNVPMIVSLSFWGGVYGLIFGMIQPKISMPAWLSGLCLGLIAAVISMVIAAPLKGNPIAYDGQAWPVVRSFLVNGFWGVGVGLILPLLQPRPLVPSDLRGSHPSHAT
jgi:hypothetical protein